MIASRVPGLCARYRPSWRKILATAWQFARGAMASYPSGLDPSPPCHDDPTLHRFGSCLDRSRREHTTAHSATGALLKWITIACVTLPFEMVPSPARFERRGSAYVTALGQQLRRRQQPKAFCTVHLLCACTHPWSNSLCLLCYVGLSVIVFRRYCHPLVLRHRSARRAWCLCAAAVLRVV